jgi:alkaline phosphatase D
LLERASDLPESRDARQTISAGEKGAPYVLDLSKLEAAVRHEGLSRRLFLAYSASLASIPLFGQRAAAKTHQPKLPVDPFSLGVASGDPTSRGVVLWTRLAPQPLVPGGGMDPHNIDVTWEIAEDDAMRNIVQHGKVVATPQLAHSVHVEVDRLAADRWYWYRFRCGDAETKVARTRTMPADDAMPNELRMAFASCQHYESGLYTAYEHMAKDELDLVFHLGDYIYEHGGHTDSVRKHAGKTCLTLDDYRIRHAQYKTDPLLQAIHRRCPWLVTWDDHEVANDYANDRSPKETLDAAKFLIRRAGAYQAYYEMMPLRHTSLPRGPKMQLYRQLSFGRLASFLMLDGRQYRSLQPHGDKSGELDDECTSPKQSMLGQRQFAWVQDQLGQSKGTWNVLANQVIMAIVNAGSEKEPKFPVDEWSGYVYERNKLAQFLYEKKIANPIVLTGDNHSNWVNDLRMDDMQTEAPVIGTEFVGTSITSGGNGQEHHAREKELMAMNAGVRFFNGERGYVRCTITPKLWKSDYQTVADIQKPGAPVVTRASFVVEAGEAGAKRA